MEDQNTGLWTRQLSEGRPTVLSISQDLTNLEAFQFTTSHQPANVLKTVTAYFSSSPDVYLVRYYKGNKNRIQLKPHLEMMNHSSNFYRTKFDLNQIDRTGQFDPLLVFKPQQVKTTQHPSEIVRDGFT